MVDQSGNEIDEPMSEEEANASVEEFGRMMEFFEGTCEICGRMRKDCSAECVEKQLATSDNSSSCDIKTSYIRKTLYDIGGRKYVTTT